MDATLAFMVDVQQISGLSEQQLRELASTLIAQIARKDQDILYRQAKIDQLTHELAVLKRWKFGKSREHLDPAQASLLDETIAGGSCQAICRQNRSAQRGFLGIGAGSGVSGLR